MRCDLVPLLEAHIAEWGGAELGYGTHDCVLFAARWVEKATGRNPIAAYGPWANEDEADAIIRRLGVPLVDLVSREMRAIPVPLADIGDIVALPLQMGETRPLGISLGVQSLFLDPARGYRRASTLVCRHAWALLP